MSTSFRNLIEINSFPPYLFSLRCCPFLWQQWKHLGRAMAVQNLHAHLFAHDISNRICASVFLPCVRKQIRLWAFEIFQKSNAGWMPLPCDQRARKLLSLPLMEEDIWMFACVSRSCSLCLKEEESAGYQRSSTEHSRSILRRWKGSRIQESWRRGSCTADSCCINTTL